MIEESTASGVFLFNPLPWKRAVWGILPRRVVELRGRPDDPTASRHFQDRGGDLHSMLLEDPPYDSGYVLEPTEVPGYGYATVPIGALHEPETVTTTRRTEIETDRFHLTVDRHRGGIASWYDRSLDCEWVDRDSEDPVAGFVHERASDGRNSQFGYPSGTDELVEMTGVGEHGRGWHPDWRAERTRVDDVRAHAVHETPFGFDVRQRLDTPALDHDFALRIVVPHDDPTVTVEAAWMMDTDHQPTATYLAFPFDVPDPTARVDVGDQAMRPGRDQLEGTCHDHYTAQRWVDLSGAGRGITVGCPLNPLVQFGSFSFGADRRTVRLDRAHLYGWVTNNYWDTNFRAAQPGAVVARYTLRPHGGFEEAAAHRTGYSAEHHDPIAHGIESVPDRPTGGQLLNLPSPPILLSHLRPASVTEPSNTVHASLHNASDTRRIASIEPGELTIVAAARIGRLGGSTHRSDGDTLDVIDGGVTIDIEARRTATVAIALAHRAR